VRVHDYLQRVGVSGSAGATLDTLRRLHVAHREAFLFENLAIQTGGAVSVAIEDIERKFLDEGRGGYCFEHNTLFRSALRDLGFTPRTLLGRVRRGPPDGCCRTHMVLRLVIDGDPWLADVGFGGLGLLEPMPLCEGATSQQSGLTYMLRREDHVWVLSCRGALNWLDPTAAPGAGVMDLYEFSEDPQTPADVEVANHFTSTHPNSMFRRTLTIQRTTREERSILRHDTFTRYAGGRIEDQSVEGPRLRALARDVFGVTLPPGPFLYERYTP
jgi:N-hydroxyarylamine O-acetyltransferase